MRSRRWTTTWLFLVLSLASGLALAQGKGRLVGKVVDAQGKALDGVVVTVTSPQIGTFRANATTDRRGSFVIDFEQINVTYQYRFEKPGYETLQVQQVWKLDGTDHGQWTMKLASTDVNLATPASTSSAAVTAFNAGVAALKANDEPTAEARFKEAVQADPKLVQAWIALASVQVQNGHNQEAAESAEKGMALGSSDEALLTARWEAYKNLKNDAKAAEALKDLEKSGRRAEEAKKIHNEAVALARAGNNEAAFAKFQEAVSTDPNLQPALIGLATAGTKIGKNAEAAAAAESVLKAEPTNQQALRLRYNACLALGDKDRLAEALAGLGPVEPAVAAKGLLALALEAYDANDKAKAKDRFQKTLAIDANQALAHYYLAMVLVNEGASTEARTHLERFLVLAPNAAEAATARDMLKVLKQP